MFESRYVDRAKGICKLPQYVDLYYPNDHGGGARDINPNGPGWSFKRFVQDNDAALGLTVELLSNSPQAIASTVVRCFPGWRSVLPALGEAAAVPL